MMTIRIDDDAPLDLADAQAVLEQDQVAGFNAVCDERALHCAGEGEELGECGGLARGGTG